MTTVRLSTTDIRARKGKALLVALTAYTAPMARLLDPHMDILLVGDSLGMALYGMESTLPVTLEMMIAHGKAVVASSKKACVVVDMPFGSYQASPHIAFEAAARVLKKTGCQAVKLEGGAEMAPTIEFLTQRAVPVMGHVGLMPQHVNIMGGYRYQGRSKQEKEKIIGDALAVEKAGAFAVVLEGVREDIAAEITKTIAIPTIGIGASPQCDGQVLVTEDMLGFFEKTPRFVKRYGEASVFIEKAARAYARDVKTRTFPAKEHCFYKDNAKSKA